MSGVRREADELTHPVLLRVTPRAIERHRDQAAAARPQTCSGRRFSSHRGSASRRGSGSRAANRLRASPVRGRLLREPAVTRAARRPCRRPASTKHGHGCSDSRRSARRARYRSQARVSRVPRARADVESGRVFHACRLVRRRHGARRSAGRLGGWPLPPSTLVAARCCRARGRVANLSVIACNLIDASRSSTQPGRALVIRASIARMVERILRCACSGIAPSLGCDGPEHAYSVSAIPFPSVARPSRR